MNNTFSKCIPCLENCFDFSQYEWHSLFSIWVTPAEKLISPFSDIFPFGLPLATN